MARKGIEGKLDAFRRWLTLNGMRGVLSLSRMIGPNGAAKTASLVGRVAGAAPFMRSRLVANLKAAGLRPTRERVDLYFRRLSCWSGWSAAIYLGGFVESGVSKRVSLDPSFRYVEEALERGRGVIISCPHMFCHEIGAAAINLRHPFVALVRESKNTIRETMKQRWYQATGLGVVKRPRKSSIMADTIAAIRVLQGGSILGITPDIIVPAEKGMPIQMFGRTVHLSPGIAVLASRVGAPVISCWATWRRGRTVGEDHCTVNFTPPVYFTKGKQSATETRDGLQEWWRDQEVTLSKNPENWMFWLDKNWTRVLQQRAA